MRYEGRKGEMVRNSTHNETDLWECPNVFFYLSVGHSLTAQTDTSSHQRSLTLTSSVHMKALFDCLMYREAFVWNRRNFTTTTTRHGTAWGLGIFSSASYYLRGLRRVDIISRFNPPVHFQPNSILKGCSHQSWGEGLNVMVCMT